MLCFDCLPYTILFQECVSQQLLNIKSILEFSWVKDITWMMLDLEV